VAVLGSGPDEVYPASNRGLARRIVEGGGCILSEYPPGTAPFKWNFPARNRIISALARGVVIVEAPASSGALITAQFALEHGKDLWVAAAGVAPGPGRAGTIKLMEDGAPVIGSAAQALEEWGVSIAEKKDDEDSGGSLAVSLARKLNINL
jgi:DNA processing protein